MSAHNKAATGGSMDREHRGSTRITVPRPRQLPPPCCHRAQLKTPSKNILVLFMNTAQLAQDFSQFYVQTTRPMDVVGNYRIVEEIGEGSFGKVYLAYHMLLNTPVVLKCGPIDDPNLVREIYYHRQLHHHHVVKLYEVLKTETKLWLVLEYCQGGELYYYVYHHKRVDPRRCRIWFRQLASAVRYCHQLGLAHRDLKLENILLSSRRHPVLKLSDFGFVREASSHRLLATVCGTPGYMAPEMLRGEKYNGLAVDIWSLGVILYAMLYGQMPFDEETEAATKLRIMHDDPVHYPWASPAAIDLLNRMLVKDPMARPSIDQVLASDYIRGKSTASTTTPTAEKPLSTMNSTANSIANAIAHDELRLHRESTATYGPDQDKAAKKLVKRFAKISMDVDQLRYDVEHHQMSPLTAFYDLALDRKCTTSKKKRKSSRARLSLSKSRQKVKSVLLGEDGQPLERIRSSLSIGSRSHSRINLARRSTDKRDDALIHTAADVSNATADATNATADASNATAGRSTLDPQPSRSSIDTAPPLNRTVSFYTEPPLSNGTTKGGKLIDRLRFWKPRVAIARRPVPRRKNLAPPAPSLAVPPLAALSIQLQSHQPTAPRPAPSIISTSTVSSVPAPAPAPANGRAIVFPPSPQTLSRGTSPRTVAADIGGRKPTGTTPVAAATTTPAAATATTTTTTNMSLPVPSSHPNITATANSTTAPAPTSPSRSRRPTSMVSQFSQLSTMDSEIDMSDSLDEFDEDDMYESSTSRSRLRPSYRRQLSDISIALGLTTTTTTTRRKLTQVSSNSSDESDIILPIPTRARRPVAVVWQAGPNAAASPVLVQDTHAVTRSGSPPVLKFNRDKVKYFGNIIDEEDED